MAKRKLIIKYIGERNSDLDKKIEEFIASVEFRNVRLPLHLRYGGNMESTLYECEFIGKTEKVWR